jgi:hypothetical protein
VQILAAPCGADTRAFDTCTHTAVHAAQAIGLEAAQIVRTTIHSIAPVDS